MPVLNVNKDGAEQAVQAETANGLEVARALNKAVLSMYSTFLAEDGSAVDYAGIKGSDEFTLYCQQTLRLLHVDLGQLARDELMAFVLNLYNALVIHGMVSLGVPASPLENETFFKDTRYRIGPHDYSLDDLEHGILRGNRPHPSGAVLFPDGDPRAQYSMDTVDPRIHFALVCGAQSCPPIRLYSANNLERGLQAAATAFLRGEVDVDTETNEIRVSRLLMWYGSDFGADASAIVQWVKPFLADEQAKDVETVLATGSMKLEFKEYVWKTNSKM